MSAVARGRNGTPASAEPTAGRRAGTLRNIAMLDEQPTRVLAFHYQLPGTVYPIREARARRLA